MPQQLSTIGRRRFVMASVKYEVLSYRIGASLDFAGGLRGKSIRMHPHIAKILPEPRLEERARLRIERLAGRAQHIMHGLRRLAPCRPHGALWLHAQLLFLLVLLRRAGGAFAANLRRRRLHRNRRVRHAHHLVGDPVCLMFKGIIDGTDGKLGLDAARPHHCQHRLVPRLALELQDRV
jgi:hypothetical protein